MWLKLPTPVIKLLEPAAGVGAVWATAIEVKTSTATPVAIAILSIRDILVLLLKGAILSLLRSCDSLASMLAFFDSGFGGLSVVKEIRKRLPGYSFTYLGDNAR